MKFITCTIFLLFSLSSSASISILSDLDDTIKITEASGNPADFVGSSVYLGMPEFFSASKTYTNDLYILSASPTAMKSHIVKTLKKNKIFYKKLTLRSNLFTDKLKYKVAAISKIMDSTQDDFIFLGDDLGKDPEAYLEVARLYPGRVLATYIHVVSGRSLASGVTPYFTSVDVFLKEFIEARMSGDSVLLAMKRLMNGMNMKAIFPRKAACPTDLSVWQWQSQTVFQREALELTEMLSSYCKQRHSSKIIL